MKVHFGEHVSRNHHGKIGTSVRVSFHASETGWTGHYHFDTHGMTPEEIAAKVRALSVHHAKKVTRLNAFTSVANHHFVAANRRFTIVDCNVWEQAGEVELYVDVREEGASQSVHGFPLRRRFATINHVTDNDGIVAMVYEAVLNVLGEEQRHEKTIATAHALISAWRNDGSLR